MGQWRDNHLTRVALIVSEVTIFARLVIRIHFWFHLSSAFTVQLGSNKFRLYSFKAMHTRTRTHTHIATALDRRVEDGSDAVE